MALFPSPQMIRKNYFLGIPQEDFLLALLEVIQSYPCWECLAHISLVLCPSAHNPAHYQKEKVKEKQHKPEMLIFEVYFKISTSFMENLKISTINLSY